MPPNSEADQYGPGGNGWSPQWPVTYRRAQSHYPVDLEPTPLDSTQLAELDQAWARPGDPIVRGASGQHECVDLAEPPSFILAATDRSDVVQLIDSPCGFLVWHGWENHEGATFPTTLGELGRE